jgi:hypothetical protein
MTTIIKVKKTKSRTQKSNHNKQIEEEWLTRYGDYSMDNLKDVIQDTKERVEDRERENLRDGEKISQLELILQKKQAEETKQITEDAAFLSKLQFARLEQLNSEERYELFNETIKRFSHAHWDYYRDRRKKPINTVSVKVIHETGIDPLLQRIWSRLADKVTKGQSNCYYGNRTLARYWFYGVLEPIKRQKVKKWRKKDKKK